MHPGLCCPQCGEQRGNTAKPTPAQGLLEGGRCCQNPAGMRFILNQETGFGGTVQGAESIQVESHLNRGVRKFTEEVIFKGAQE